MNTLRIGDPRAVKEYMYNCLPRFCRSLVGYAHRSSLPLVAALVCLATNTAIAASAFNFQTTLANSPTPWNEYKWQIIGAISFMIVETLLIAFLLVSRTRRRSAEAERERFALLAQSEHRRLEEVVSNVPGIVWESRVESNGTKVSCISC